MQWIDTHCHIFTPETAGETPVMIDGRLNTTDTYAVHGFADQLPSGVVVVDFSKAVTSAHVMAALNDLNTKGIPARGIIRGHAANPQTLQWLKHPQVSGIRLYALAELPDLSRKSEWNALFDGLRRRGQHIACFGKPGLLRELTRQLPQDLPLLIDHLGSPDAAIGPNQHDYALLLADLAARHRTAGPVYFKGPGYRTSLDPSKVAPFLHKILDLFGDTQLLLGASDAPFAGPVMENDARYTGKTYQQCLGYRGILPWLQQLVEITAHNRSKSAEMLQMQWLYSNAARFYGFDQPGDVRKRA